MNNRPWWEKLADDVVKNQSRSTVIKWGEDVYSLYVSLRKAGFKHNDAMYLLGIVITEGMN